MKNHRTVNESVIIVATCLMMYITGWLFLYILFKCINMVLDLYV